MTFDIASQQDVIVGLSMPAQLSKYHPVYQMWMVCILMVHPKLPDVSRHRGREMGKRILFVGEKVAMSEIYSCMLLHHLHVFCILHGTDRVP